MGSRIGPFTRGAAWFSGWNVKMICFLLRVSLFSSDNHRNACTASAAAGARNTLVINLIILLQYKPVICLRNASMHI